MALLAPLFAFIGRQVGRIVQMAFGWATIMLFGRVPQRKQLLLAGVALGSILWVVTLIGVLVPDVGAFLIALVPAPDFVDEDWIRLVMLGLAIALPLAVGAGGLLLMDAADRPKGIGGKLVQLLRGYPYAAVLSLVILFLLVVAPIFKLRTIFKRWEDAHIPIVVKPDGYEQVARDLEAAIDGAGLDLSRARAPRVLEAAISSPRGSRWRERAAAGSRADRDAACAEHRGDDPSVGRRDRRREGRGRAGPSRGRGSAHQDRGVPDRERGGAAGRGRAARAPRSRRPREGADRR